MKMRFLLLFALLFFTVFSLSAQTWQYTFGGALDDNGTGIAELSSGQYVIGGLTESFTTNTSQNLLMAIDDNGSVLWEKRTGGGTSNEVGGVATHNGEIFAAGSTDDASPASLGGFLQKYSGNGNLQITNLSFISTLEQFSSVDVSPSGAVYAGGFSFQNGIDAFVGRFNNNGSVIWTRTVGNPSTAELSFDVLATTDGGVLVYGVTSQGAGSDDLFFSKLDSLGNISWTRLYGTNSQDGVNDVIQTSTGYVACGRTNFTGNNEAFLFKMDNGGNLVWANYYAAPGTQVANAVVQRGDHYIMAGEDVNFGVGNSNGFLVEFDSTGNRIWARSYGITGDQRFLDLILPSSGGIMALGISESQGAGFDDIWVVRTDSLGNASCDDTTFTFPPANGLMWVSTPPAAFISIAQGANSPKSWTATNTTLAIDTVCPPPPCMLMANVVVADTLLCDGDTMFATNATSGSTSQTWLENGNQVGTGTSLVRTPVFSGLYSYTLIVDDSLTGCSDTLDFTVELLPAPGMSISPGNIVCEGDSMLFTNNTANATGGQWFVGGQLVGTGLTISLVPTQPGTFPVVLLSEPGDCPASDSISIEPLANAAFTANPVGISVDFTDMSTNAATWFWDFGDGSTSTDQNPSHIYAGPGNYTVCLTAVSSAGCFDTTCQTVSVIVGINDALSAGITVAPNPFTDHLEIGLPQGIQIFQAELSDIRGATLGQWENEPGQGDEMRLDLEGTAPRSVFLATDRTRESVCDQGRKTVTLIFEV